MDLMNGSEGQVGQENLKGLGTLLKIPNDIIFPLELSIHLKERLQAALEEIFRLRKQLFSQDHELTCLHLKAEKSKSDKYFETKEHKMSMAMANPQMATKVVELCKKNRDMMAEMESMKTRMKQIMSENEWLKKEAGKKEESIDLEQPVNVVAKSEEEILSMTQQLTNATTKMMDYRRQSQQTRLELRTALKALSHEVGEGTTPQNILTTVSNSSWRGRQQQILTLQQKVHELQQKLSALQQQQQHHHHHHHQHGHGDEGGGGEPCQLTEVQSICSTTTTTSTDLLMSMDDKISLRSVGSLPVSATQRRIMGLHQQEKKKFEQLEKMSQALEDSRKELKTCQQTLKGYKARVQTLEDQVKACRNQIGTLEGRLGAKQIELQDTLHEMTSLKQEFGTMKDRMRIIRDKASAEVTETSQALIKEKNLSSKLQQTIEGYEQKLLQMAEHMREYQVSLAAYEKSPKDDLEARKRLQFLELQFEEIKGGMKASENETRRLLEMMNESVHRIENERLAHTQSQRHLVKAIAVIDQGDQCLRLCLDAGGVSDKKVLETVEDFRSMIRELKTTGDLYHLEPAVMMNDMKKLKSRVSVQSKEIVVLHKTLKQSAMERKMDLQNFSSIADRTRQDFFTALANNVKRKQGNYSSNCTSSSSSSSMPKEEGEAVL